MGKIYFTITGMNHYFGQDVFEPGMEVRLVKDHENEVDNEAIKVELDGLGTVGYVANSCYTILGESYSAGRLYDMIGETCYGKVRYVTGNGTIGYLELQPEEVLRAEIKHVLQVM